MDCKTNLLLLFVTSGVEDDCWSTAESFTSQEDRTTSYANCNNQMSAMPPDPFDTSRAYEVSGPTPRYYSHVTPEHVPKINNSSAPSTHRPYSNAEVEESPVKKLDSKFISELEKHLGQKEASANTHNTWNHMELKSSTNEAIPTLLPPPQSTGTRSLQRKPSNVTVPNYAPLPAGSLVQNSWSTKSVNLRSDSNRYSRSQSVCLPQSFSPILNTQEGASREHRYRNLSTSDAFGSSPNVNGDVKNVNSFDQNLTDSESLLSKMWISQQQERQNVYGNTNGRPERQNVTSTNQTQPHQYDPVDSTWSNYAQTPSSTYSQASFNYTSTRSFVSVSNLFYIWTIKCHDIHSFLISLWYVQTSQMLFAGSC